RAKFLSADAYCPLPSLIAAARELFTTEGKLRRISRAATATDPAVEEISRIIHTAAHTKSRHLILLSGAPGAGKTLVGLRTVHSHYLDDLAVERGGAKHIPAVFLSGNQPLVNVLQYELRDAGGDGKTFVRHVKEYIKRYSGKRSTPPEHVLVFDEAQRAHDEAQVEKTHDGKLQGSEPALFIEFADRIPDWCVVLGLIGSGQEIHVGEEAGLSQWKTAVEGARNKAEWTIHAPPNLLDEIGVAAVPIESRPTLHLGTELRFHAAADVHRFVALVLEGGKTEAIREVASLLESAEHHLRLTRDLGKAKAYLRERYADDSERRFGMLASSRDTDLVKCGVPNDWQERQYIGRRLGPWYGDDESAESGLSCRLLERSVSEFEAQGLELDAVLLAWGTDLMRVNAKWSNARAARYRTPVPVRDPMQLRINAYRVLLTRGRDGTVVYVPELPVLDETYAYLLAVGFREL
ncbi:MAG: DNA/RNA helicase domain-containing protein, partial [Gemmatimonadales bacterium]